MRPLAPVRVRRDDQRWRGWKAVCRVCGQSATTAPHAEALAWAHGHMHVRHPGWGRPRTTKAHPLASRLLGQMYHSTCPRCDEWKFIGHGPLCVDCWKATE